MTAPSLEGRAETDEAPEAVVVSFRSRWFERAAHEHQLTRFVLLRGLGCIYVVAFTILIQQLLPLLGKNGLMPIDRFLQRVAAANPTLLGRLASVPSLLWIDSSDAFMLALCWVGLCLALALALGLANAPLSFALWLVYGSFVHTGQTFYGYGWELLLLEAGFLAIFLVPLWRPWPRSEHAPPLPVIWLYRWLLFRLMFGAGLIKLRGDSCWTDLTCLTYHYETQPNPHPLSWLLHQAPSWFQHAGVLFNHFVELIVPFGLFGPRRLRHVAGALTALFQVTLILSGNLSFLNWLTLVLCLACFDDTLLGRLLPRALHHRLREPGATAPSTLRRGVTFALCATVGVLSLNPVANMLSPRQRMNAGFDPLRIVNSYGAFGSVSRVRHEVVLEGAAAPPAGTSTASESLVWRELEFPCKPGDPARAPCWVTPYHYRLDWQMWFLALGRPEQQPWIFNLVYKLLQGDARVSALLRRNPFADRPPKYVRATLYRYELTHFGEAGWWRRTLVGPYLPALSLDDARLQDVLGRLGWL